MRHYLAILRVAAVVALGLLMVAEAIADDPLRVAHPPSDATLLDPSMDWSAESTTLAELKMLRHTTGFLLGMVSVGCGLVFAQILFSGIRP